MFPERLTSFCPKEVNQAAKDLMSRALQGSCDLGAAVKVWFSLVLEYLSCGLLFSGSKVSTLEQALIRTVRIWQGRGEKRLTKCLLQWGFVRKSTFVEEKTDSKFYKWFWSNRSVCSWVRRESRDGEMNPKKKENKAIVYYTSCWTNGLYADLMDSFRRAWDSGSGQRPRRCQWSNLCVINYTSLPDERGQSFARVWCIEMLFTSMYREKEAGTRWEGLVNVGRLST